MERWFDLMTVKVTVGSSYDLLHFIGNCDRYVYCIYFRLILSEKIGYKTWL